MTLSTITSFSEDLQMIIMGRSKQSKFEMRRYSLRKMVNPDTSYIECEFQKTRPKRNEITNFEQLLP